MCNKSSLRLYFTSCAVPNIPFPLVVFTCHQPMGACCFAGDNRTISIMSNSILSGDFKVPAPCGCKMKMISPMGFYLQETVVHCNLTESLVRVHACVATHFTYYSFPATSKVCHWYFSQNFTGNEWSNSNEGRSPFLMASYRFSSGHNTEWMESIYVRLNSLKFQL